MPRNALVIHSSAVPGLAELSGLAYRGSLGGAEHEWLAVQDSGNQLVTLSLELAPDGALTSAAATATQTISPGFDFEGVAHQSSVASSIIEVAAMSTTWAHGPPMASICSHNAKHHGT